MRECPTAAHASTETQRQQRKVLKGLSLMPVPASLFLFRGETAAAAGLGAGTGGVAGCRGDRGRRDGRAGSREPASRPGMATAWPPRSQSSAAAAVAVGGVGYGVTKARTTRPSDRQGDAQLAQTRDGARAEQVRAGEGEGRAPGPASTASDRARAATAAAHAQIAKARSGAARCGQARQLGRREGGG